MLSPFSSALAKLDDSLQTIDTQIERLRGGVNPNEDQLRQSLVDACRCATILGDLISAQRSNVKGTDHRALDRLLRELKLLTCTKRRRLKLLDLAMELRAGRVHHHRVNRTEALNQLRLRALGELQATVTHASQEKDLPGPTSSKWMHWACGLQEKADAATLQVLRRDFPAVEEFIAEMDDRYWVSGQNHAAEFPSEEALGAAEESAAEPLPVSALGAIEANLADHDRLARNLLAIFEKSLLGGPEALSRASKEPSYEAPPSPELAGVSTGDPSSNPAPKVGKRDAEIAHRWVGLTENEGKPLIPLPKKLEKARIDKAAALDFMKVMNAWHLDDGQARRLLGISRTLFRQLREGRSVTLGPEKLTRISLLVTISKGLNVLYGTRRGEKWVHRPNSSPLFDGTEPLKYMLKEGVEGLFKVRELVGVWSGYISPDQNP